MGEAQAVRGRFAPSPTGEIHLGNVWTALLAWLHARQHGGRFVLRVEDLDPDRSRPELAAAQLADLRWLGLDWDEGPDVGGRLGPYVQSERTARYERAIEVLAGQDLLYPCYCTRAEIRAAASAPHGAERGDYPGTCRNLTLDQRKAREAQGRRPCLRARMPDAPTLIRFDDLVCGPMEEDVAGASGDFVVRRADGVHAYQLAVVVDDGLMGITHVVRGADLLGSTARQIWLHQWLGLVPPRFGHVPLLVGADGHRLSKRHASLSVARLRAAGAKPREIIGNLAHLAGMVPSCRPAMPHDLIGALDLSRLPRQAIVIRDA
jgi:glutamyl-tRNA synthetase